MEHTKGPWVVEEFNDGLHVTVGPPTGHSIAEIDTYHNFGFKGPLNQANARLIAAAPDLLAACERISDHEFRSDRRKRGMVDISEVEDLMRIARNAIAKVKGV